MPLASSINPIRLNTKLPLCSEIHPLRRKIGIHFCSDDTLIPTFKASLRYEKPYTQLFLYRRFILMNREKSFSSASVINFSHDMLIDTLVKIKKSGQLQLDLHISN